MLLRRSGDKKSETYNLNAITNAEGGEVGIENEAFLLKVADSVYAEDPAALSGIREEGRQLFFR